MKKLFVFFLVSLLVAGVGYWIYLRSDLERYCVNSRGHWIPEHKECEGGGSDSGISQFKCLMLGGKYYSPSPCRHLPDYPNVACQDVMVYVCKF
jgi:hypothetical protein